MTKSLREEIGHIRQWLNENRITDPSKMVSNEDLEVWLSNYEQKLKAEIIKELEGLKLESQDNTGRELNIMDQPREVLTGFTHAGWNMAVDEINHRIDQAIAKIKEMK